MPLFVVSVKPIDSCSFVILAGIITANDFVLFDSTTYIFRIPYYYQYAYITRGLSKPVMKDKLVDICIKILRSLPHDGLHLNAIFRQTGLSSYKPDVVEAVRILKEGELIMSTTTPAHKQKEIKQLTELGYEFKNLMVSIEKYEEAFLKFEQRRVEEFGDKPLQSLLRSIGWSNEETKKYEQTDSRVEKSVDHDQPVSSVLRSRGWLSEEIDKYEQTWLSTIEIKDFLIKNIFNALISRYAAIVHRIKKNDIAREILIKFVTNQISRQLSIVSNESDYPMDTVFQELTSVIDEVPEFYHNPIYFLHNHFINNEIKDVIALLLYLVIPRNVVKTNAEIKIAMLEESIERLEKSTKRRKREYKAELRGDKELLDIFKRLQIIIRSS